MVLAVSDLDLFYGDAQALSGVSIDVAEGEIVAIVGANGAGKTSLIRGITGLVPARSGRIVYRGEDITGWESHRICEKGVGQVAEGRQVFPSMSVLENLEMGAMTRRARSSARSSMDEVFGLFPRLAERRDQTAGTLSGGEQQMLAIGRCLMGRPDLILFDEPSLGLAPVIVAEMFAIVKRLNADGHAIVLVEQNVSVSLKLADRGYVLENGHIVQSGPGRELLADDGIRRAYLGL
ncbi:MAG: ABC transporter ATP-binding protein [Pseudomonadota bacterium]